MPRLMQRYAVWRLSCIYIKEYGIEFCCYVDAQMTLRPHTHFYFVWNFSKNKFQIYVGIQKYFYHEKINLGMVHMYICVYIK